MWKASNALVVGLVLILAAAGCEGENAFVDGLLTVGEDELLVERFDIAGFWTGTEEITRRGDISPGSGNDDGFSFPIAIRFDDDGEFVLRSFNYPLPGGGTADRTCVGVFDRDGRNLMLFPNQSCAPLPLFEFTIGRTLPDGLVLTAESGNITGATGDVSVRIALERD